MKKILYLTFNDAPSGIYAGQVIDVCRYWKEELNFDVQLLAFISLRGFSANKKQIRSRFPGAIVLPMVPRARNWKLNRFLLGSVIRRFDPATIVCRGPFAASLAFRFRKNRTICFDGRGAYVAELNEYNVVPDEKVKSEIGSLERSAVLESDFRLAVSEALVNYWKRSFGYSDTAHVVVPCTLNRTALEKTAPQEEVRSRFGFTADDVIIVYSGSLAGWQSLDVLDEYLAAAFAHQPSLRLLLLLREIPARFSLKENYPERVKQAWLSPEEVMRVTSACDYGWLVRETSVTNEVASPVKFAEYLAAGLKVMISPGLGDYSAFVKAHEAGAVMEKNNAAREYPPVAQEEKQRMKELARNFFQKENYKAQYLRMLT